jgi:hypothetical protein
MTLLDEIKIFLDLIGTLGTIKKGYMPGTPDEMGMLKEYGGQSPERKFGVAGVGYEKPSFQLVFRGSPFDYNGPRAKAEIAFRALSAITPGALCAGVTTEYLMIEPQQSPHPTEPIDSNNRHNIGINFYATKGLS